MQQVSVHLIMATDPHHPETLLEVASCGQGELYVVVFSYHLKQQLTKPDLFYLLAHT